MIIQSVTNCRFSKFIQRAFDSTLELLPSLPRTVCPSLATVHTCSKFASLILLQFSFIFQLIFILFTRSFFQLSYQHSSSNASVCACFHWILISSARYFRCLFAVVQFSFTFYYDIYIWTRQIRLYYNRINKTTTQFDNYIFYTQIT